MPENPWENLHKGENKVINVKHVDVPYFPEGTSSLHANTSDIQWGRVEKELPSEIWETAKKLSQWLKEAIPPHEEGFITTLKNNVPPELMHFFDNLTAADIANIIVLVITVVMLAPTGVWVVPAVTYLAWQLGVRSAISRIIIMAMNSEKTTSALLGLIPWAKNIAPNQPLASVVIEIKILACW